MKSDAETANLAETDEKPLCTHCLMPNTDSANFCVECGAPLTSYAATGPLEQVFAEGHLYRQAVQQPRKPIVVLGVWLLFGMTAISGVVPLFATSGIGLLEIISAGLFVPISAFAIWITTTRYLAHRRSRAGNPV